MNVLRNRWIQLSALIALIAGIGIKALRLKFCVRDSDIWWHLKVGDWIIDHFALPQGYEVLMSRAYAWFGLLGIG
jgi:hypothetical protein